MWKNIWKTLLAHKEKKDEGTTIRLNLRNKDYKDKNIGKKEGGTNNQGKNIEVLDRHLCIIGRNRVGRGRLVIMRGDKIKDFKYSMLY